MKRYYDNGRNRLIYLGNEATPEYWDGLWRSRWHRIRVDSPGRRRPFVAGVTPKYLKPADGQILEGGCGLAEHVLDLTNLGYQCVGIDFAPETIGAVSEAHPELDVRLGDVRKLQFDDDAFAGYWSLGVIEHFWDGFEEIGREMARVIRSGGYLFLVFPYMSPLRNLKARLGRYPRWEENVAPESFYQFALDRHLVVSSFASWGFELVGSHPRAGLIGTKDEIAILKPLLQRLYDYRGSSLLVRGFRYVLNSVLSSFAGHTILLTFVMADKPKG